jgi:hypothetical protein
MTQAQVCWRWRSAGRSAPERHRKRKARHDRERRPKAPPSDLIGLGSTNPSVYQAVTHAVRVFCHVKLHNDEILDFGRWDLAGVGQARRRYPDPSIYRERALGLSERRNQRRTSRKETP